MSDNDPIITMLDMLRMHGRLDAEEANALERAHLAATPPHPEPGLREQVVIEMENEGVVTWGDARHRARFIGARRVFAPVSLEDELDRAALREDMERYRDHLDWAKLTSLRDLKIGPDLAPPDGGKDGSFRRAWCHPIGEGHPTAREAAEHLADLAVAQWGAALGEDVK